VLASVGDAMVVEGGTTWELSPSHPAALDEAVDEFYAEGERRIRPIIFLLVLLDPPGWRTSSSLTLDTSVRSFSCKRDRLVQ
jgi:hypothetical protein